MVNNELKKVNIKNHMFYYFNDIIETEDFDFVDILLDKKSYENILIYDILYKPLRIMSDNVDEFIRDYGGA